MSSETGDICLIRRADGTAVIGTTHSLDNDPMADWSGMPKGRHDIREVVSRCLSLFPSVSREGHAQVSKEELEGLPTQGVPSISLLKEASTNTNNILMRMRDQVTAYKPPHASHLKYVRDGFDGLIDQVNKWSMAMVESSNQIDFGKAFKERFDVSDDFLATDFASSCQELSEVPEALANTLHKYTAVTWLVSLADNGSALIDSQLARSRLRFRKDDALDRAVTDKIIDKKRYLENCRTEPEAKLEVYRKQLNRLSDRVGIPQRTFEQGSYYWHDLGKYAPSYEEWRTAVDEVRTHGWSRTAEIIRGWPGHKDYNSAYIAAELKFSKKKAKRKKKKGLQTADDEQQTEATQVSLATGDSQATELAQASRVEVPEQDLDEEQSSVDYLRPNKPLNQKKHESAAGYRAVYSTHEWNVSNGSTIEKVKAWMPQEQTMAEIRQAMRSQMLEVHDMLERERQERSQRLSQRPKVAASTAASKDHGPSTVATNSKRRTAHVLSKNPTSSQVSRRYPNVLPARPSKTQDKDTATNPAFGDLSAWPTLGDQRGDIAKTSDDFTNASLSTNDCCSQLEERAEISSKRDSAGSVATGIADDAQEKSRPNKSTTMTPIGVPTRDQTRHYQEPETEDLAERDAEIVTGEDDHDPSIAAETEFTESSTQKGDTDQATADEMIGPTFLDEGLNFEGVDARSLVTAARYAQYLEDHNPGSAVSIQDIVDAMGGWDIVRDTLSGRPRSAVEQRSVPE